MIRAMELSDIEAMVRLAIEADMFPEEASDFLRSNAQRWFDEDRQPGRWVVVARDQQVDAVAFYEPRDATDRVWYLTMIVVSPSLQGTGVGRRLLNHVEHALREADQRLLLIETSGTPAYESSRAFYARGGYREVARVPDYFADGDDMVLFHKDLRAAP
ncbi:MAG: GNAT family N-acetyltransferase [Myxococcota bacterium]